MSNDPAFTKKLVRWYEKNARDLPWRRTRDPYKIWISEIMLQQTTVNAVIPYYTRWIKEFPSVNDVAKAPAQKILRLWQGLGYYQRAKNIHKSAKIICRVYGGKIPNNPKLLEKLPGFGAYTVGAVSSIAFDYSSPIIDANVRRVVMRQTALNGRADTSRDTAILAFLKKVIPRKDCGTFNQALMELGALICRNRKPLCPACPVLKGCQAFKKGIQEIIPAPQKRTVKNIDVAVAVMRSGNAYFIQKRPPKGLLADLWEFPGGKVEKGETPRQALVREIQEELGVRIKVLGHVANLTHSYTQFRVKLHVWFCRPEFPLASDKTHRWVCLGDFSKYPMPSGSAKIAGTLRNKTYPNNPRPFRSTHKSRV